LGVEAEEGLEDLESGMQDVENEKKCVACRLSKSRHSPENEETPAGNASSCVGVSSYL
jgi:hypothetical protein